jgi:hypothetical protein
MLARGSSAAGFARLLGHRPSGACRCWQAARACAGWSPQCTPPMPCAHVTAQAAEVAPVVQGARAGGTRPRRPHLQSPVPLTITFASTPASSRRPCRWLSTCFSTLQATPHVILCAFCSSAGRKCIASLPTCSGHIVTVIISIFTSAELLCAGGCVSGLEAQSNCILLLTAVAAAPVRACTHS